MERVAVQSSNLKSVGYDPETSTLEVEFSSGSRYRYDGVPADVHASLMSAPSVGSFFARQIRGQYEGHKVERSEPAAECEGGQA